MTICLNILPRCPSTNLNKYRYPLFQNISNPSIGDYEYTAGIGDFPIGFSSAVLMD
jgi:hypothetical protein